MKPPRKYNTDKPKMMMNNTLNQLRGLRLETMAQALEQQLTHPLLKSQAEESL